MAEELAQAVITHSDYAYSGPLVSTDFEGARIYVPPSPTSQRTYLTHLIATDPVVFLSNYHALLSPSQLSLFSESADPLVQELLKTYSPEAKAIEARNRRFARLQELIEAGDYFSEAAVSERHPALYSEFIGKYRDIEEKAEVPNSLSDALFSLMDRTERLKRTAGVKKKISREELEENEDFVLRTAHESYLAMADPTVDADEKYDDIETRGRDLEERWFDED